MSYAQTQIRRFSQLVAGTSAIPRLAANVQALSLRCDQLELLVGRFALRCTSTCTQLVQQQITGYYDCTICSHCILVVGIFSAGSMLSRLFSGCFSQQRIADDKQLLYLYSTPSSSRTIKNGDVACGQQGCAFRWSTPSPIVCVARKGRTFLIQRWPRSGTGAAQIGTSNGIFFIALNRVSTV